MWEERINCVRAILRSRLVWKYVDRIDNLERQDPHDELQEIMQEAQNDEKLSISEYLYLYGYATQKANWIY